MGLLIIGGVIVLYFIGTGIMLYLALKRHKKTMKRIHSINDSFIEAWDNDDDAEYDNL